MTSYVAIRGGSLPIVNLTCDLSLRLLFHPIIFPHTLCYVHTSHHYYCVARSLDYATARLMPGRRHRPGAVRSSAGAQRAPATSRPAVARYARCSPFPHGARRRSKTAQSRRRADDAEARATRLAHPAAAASRLLRASRHIGQRRDPVHAAVTTPHRQHEQADVAPDDDRWVRFQRGSRDPARTSSASER